MKVGSNKWSDSEDSATLSTVLYGRDVHNKLQTAVVPLVGHFVHGQTVDFQTVIHGNFAVSIV